MAIFPAISFSEIAMDSSIGTGGLEYYDGAALPGWRGSFFVAGLRSFSLSRVSGDTAGATADERLLESYRFRDGSELDDEEYEGEEEDEWDDEAEVEEEDEEESETTSSITQPYLFPVARREAEDEEVEEEEEVEEDEDEEEHKLVTPIPWLIAVQETRDQLPPSC